MVQRLDAQAEDIVTPVTGKKGMGGPPKARKLSAEEQSMTELVRARMKESHSSELLGFAVESVQAGKAVFRLDVKQQHTQIHGVVHGGILAALADTTGAIAAYTTVPRGVELATLELKINYLEPVPGGRVRAEARVLRAGRNFIVTECDIFNTEGKLAAKAMMTFSAAQGYKLAK
jgi:uncharacterized protein (TIGR00369 family)